MLMKIISKIFNILRNPLIFVTFLDNKGIVSLDDETYLKILFKYNIGKKLNLKNPQTFNEKLQWLKINDRKFEYVSMVDKYEAKKYVSSIIGEKYIVPTYGVYDKFDDIDFDSLPNEFVVKTTHYGGNNGIYIVKNKCDIDYSKMKKGITSLMKKNLFYYGREWPYLNVKPRILIEKYISDINTNETRDYKFYCFNGRVYVWFVCSDRKNNVKFTFFDRNGKFLDIKQCGADNDKYIEKPINLNKMIELAEKLSKNITQVRVDFYEVNGNVFFSELTFFDTSGFGKFEPESWDVEMGKMLKLPYENKE